MCAFRARISYASNGVLFRDYKFDCYTAACNCELRHAMSSWKIKILKPTMRPVFKTILWLFCCREMTFDWFWIYLHCICCNAVAAATDRHRYVHIPSQWLCWPTVYWLDTCDLLPDLHWCVLFLCSIASIIHLWKFRRLIVEYNCIQHFGLQRTREHVSHFFTTKKWRVTAFTHSQKNTIHTVPLLETCTQNDNASDCIDSDKVTENDL